MAGAEPERVKREVEEVVGLDCSRAILASAKQGIGIDEILEEVVRRIPPPPDRTAEPLRALIFDSYYDPYKASVRSVLCVQLSSLRPDSCNPGHRGGTFWAAKRPRPLGGA